MSESDFTTGLQETETIPQYKEMTPEEAIPGNNLLREESPEAYKKLMDYFMNKQENPENLSNTLISPRRVVWTDTSMRPFGTPTIEFFATKDVNGTSEQIHDGVTLQPFESGDNALTPEEKKAIYDAAEKNVNIDYKGGA